MRISFDLISDLHIETWNNFDWTGQATSPFCIVAGDVAKDRTIVLETLKHLSQCYRVVFYIDGNDEHKYYMKDIGQSYQDLNNTLDSMPNVVYLQDNVIVMDGIAIVGTNGWWSFDLDPNIDINQTKYWWENEQIDPTNAQLVEDLSRTDAAYLIKTMQRLQRHQDVRKIIVVTHTVPRQDLINHDIKLEGTYRFNCMGNSLMEMVQHSDTESKLHTWCFGHYHNPVDRLVRGVRFVNNCRGRGDTEHSNPVYYPKRIELD
jgi:UDP-2,3-diacylglucosamine pyrophosphatase LpxH